MRMVATRVPEQVDREIEVLAAKAGTKKRELIELGLRMVIAVARHKRVPPELARMLDERAKDIVARLLVNLADDKE